MKTTSNLHPLWCPQCRTHLTLVAGSPCPVCTGNVPKARKRFFARPGDPQEA